MVDTLRYRDCGFLNQYYIETRYPADTPLIVEDYEAEECIGIAEDIYIETDCKITF